MPVRPIHQMSPAGGTIDPNYPTQRPVPPDYDQKEYAIAGECLAVSFSIDMFALEKYSNENAAKDEIKKRLCQQLVEEMMKSKYIEFTSEHNKLTDIKIFRARIFATPDAQVRLLRQLKVIK